MKEKLIAMLIKALLDMLSPALIESFADLMLDWVEDYAIGTGSKFDDKILLQLCLMIRDTFNIPEEENIDDVSIKKI